VFPAKTSACGVFISDTPPQRILRGSDDLRRANGGMPRREMEVWSGERRVLGGAVAFCLELTAEVTCGRYEE
jgi:hypothetical protein